jgi:transposase
VKLGLTCVDVVRRRVQQDTLGHRGYADDPLFRTRRLLRRRADRLTSRQRQRLDAALNAGDPTGQVIAAWLVAQQLMAAYAAPDRVAGRAAADAAITLALTCPVPEITRLGRTLRGWRTEFLARFDQPQVSNGPTECLNLKVKNTKRVSVNRPCVSRRASARRGPTGRCLMGRDSTLGTLHGRRPWTCGWRRDRRGIC